MNSIGALLKDAEVEKEVEYVYWLKVTEETLERLTNHSKFTSYMDVFWNKVKARYRIFSEHNVEYTKKELQTDGTKIEHNIKDVPFGIAKDAIKYAENIHRVKRVLIPITKAGTDEPLIKKSTGEQLHWEVDLFYINKKGTELLEWVKVELEVDNFTIETLQHLIPIPYLELIDESKGLPEDRAIISNVWNQLANVAY